MDLRHLELVRELADRGSIAAVAAAQHRTPSAVSQQLKTLQRELGVSLVEPDGRGLRLTDAGLLLADGAVDVASSVARVRARWDAFVGEAVGTVTLAAFPSAAAMFFPALLRDLDGTGIDLVCTDQDAPEHAIGAMVAHHDVVLNHGLTPPAPDPRVRVTPLMREPLDVAVPLGHPLAGRDAVRPADLMDHDWIGVPQGFPFDTVLQDLARRTGQVPRVVQRLRDIRATEALVAAGHGIALLPRFTTAPSDAFALLPLRSVRAGRHVVALSRPDRAERLAVRRVTDLLRTCADTHVARHA
ncbi:LysR family transcriptional regulator [Solicola sp. PLA-1-18]|uniref:LysR family transcriptional regulator n=1 Tax=Solicola sp. PLA-1-18 TaxID=3380532 RepID=UPI003B814AD9